MLFPHSFAKSIKIAESIPLWLSLIHILIALLSGGRQESFSPPPFDAAAQTGAPEVPENAGYGEMDAKAFRFSAAGELEVQAVSYTHLDVYKRQSVRRPFLISVIIILRTETER